jgi:hypothetical protein
VRVAIYARVSTEAQEARGTIGSQLAVLRSRVAAEGDELVAEFCDDGYTATRGRALTAPGWTGCGMRPRPGCWMGSGACHRTGWPAPTPTR